MSEPLRPVDFSSHLLRGLAPTCVDLRASAAHLDTFPLLSQGARARRARLRAGDVRFVRTPFGELRVREQRSRSGPRLLIGVDGPNVLEHYDRLLEMLAERADVVVFEPPGTGGSAPPRGFDFRLGSFAGAAEALLAELGPRTLVFPCYLGLVAQEVARRAPQLAPRVVLPQTVTVSDLARWADRVDPRRLLRTPFLGQAVVAARRRAIARGWYRASVGHPACRARLSSVADEALRAGGCFCLASLMQGLEVDLGGPSAVAVPLPVPAAIVWGGRDRTHARSDPARSLPGAEVVRFDDSGHCPDLEEPERFAAWLLAWHGDKS